MEIRRLVSWLCRNFPEEAFLLDCFGAVYQRMNGNVTQEFLQSHLTVAEHYTGSFLYQGLGFVALVVLAFVMRDRKAKAMNSGEELSKFVSGLRPFPRSCLEFWSGPLGGFSSALSSS